MIGASRKNYESKHTCDGISYSTWSPLRTFMIGWLLDHCKLPSNFIASSCLKFINYSSTSALDRMKQMFVLHVFATFTDLISPFHILAHCTFEIRRTYWSKLPIGSPVPFESVPPSHQSLNFCPEAADKEGKRGRRRSRLCPRRSLPRIEPLFAERGKEEELFRDDASFEIPFRMFGNRDQYIIPPPRNSYAH